MESIVENCFWGIGVKLPKYQVLTLFSLIPVQSSNVHNVKVALADPIFSVTSINKIHLTILTNNLFSLDKCLLQFGQIQIPVQFCPM